MLDFRNIRFTDKRKTVESTIQSNKSWESNVQADRICLGHKPQHWSTFSLQNLSLKLPRKITIWKDLWTNFFVWIDIVKHFHLFMASFLNHAKTHQSLVYIYLKVILQPFYYDRGKQPRLYHSGGYWDAVEVDPSSIVALYLCLHVDYSHIDESNIHVLT